MFSQKRPIKMPSDCPPQLIVVIDTEEEFDWSADPDPNQNTVRSMEFIDRVQSIFNDYGICPCYVIDYPVASQASGTALLKKFYDAGQCEIGAHLHPWVNPPILEPISVRNMYPGNLDPELERGKLLHLRNTIADVFGEPPRVYKAGRYGFGPNTESILSELGFEIDLSLCPPVDYRSDGGPDYRQFSAEPFWFGSQPLLEIPVTGAFVGWAKGAALPIYELANRFKVLKAPAILSRLSALDRLMLSPEGFKPREHIKLARALYNQGVRTFTWSFHSSSVVPGNTIYVQEESELNEFLQAFRRFFDFFFDELGGRATTPTRLKTMMETVT
ncbi:hypothetical protein GCM10007392_16080 [Saccharospirillum salsuginis]|uniref:WalW protein n=1 Tax=Saccharospirillum salsuginis TaxID=418750 RepID=A0A918N783_9GAMM|nr:hypothetical protein GCM10007392_16080 [Saccharospirillum salsuginis]